MSEPPYAGEAPWMASGPATPDPLISGDYNGWWQRSIAIVKACWRQLLVLQAIGAGVGFLLRGPAAVVQALITRDVRTTAPARPDQINFGTIFAGLGLTLLLVLLAILVTALVTLAAVHVVVATATGGQASVGDALRRATRRVFPLIGWEMLALLIILAGICACVLPGIYLAAVFMVLPVVVAFERANAIGRCFTLFHGNLGASLARIATIVAISIGGAIVAGVFGAVVTAVLAPPTTVDTGALIAGNLVNAVVSSVFAAAIGVLTTPMVVTAYADMRARIEPLSTSILVQELSSS
jgi:hypothetical protein